MSKPKAMREVKLGELLTVDQAEQVSRLLARHEHDNLRVYLNSIGEELLDKGVVADYLYYYLLYKFGQ